jgi:integrase
MTTRLQSKDGYWYGIINYKDHAGKYKKKWISTGLSSKGNKRKAEKVLQAAVSDFKEELQNQALRLEAPAKVMTMSELIREWLPLKKLELRENTYVAYEDTANIHVLPYFDELGVTIGELSPAHIQRYYAEKTKAGIGPGTLTRHRTIIRSSLEYAIQTLGILKANPADRVKLPKQNKRLPSFYTEEQLKNLFKAVEGESIEAPVKLAAYFGLRRSEVLALRWNSINWKRKTISITHTLVRVKTKTEFKDTVKQMASYRTMPLMPVMETYLRKLQAHQKQLRKICGKDFNPEGFLCIWDDGTVLEPDYVTSRFRRFLKEKGLPLIRFHDLRHSSASLLINNGCTLKEVQEWLGQASSKSTEIYAHMLYESKYEMADKINTALAF